MINKTLNITTSPHITKGLTTDVIMKNVVFAMLPLVVSAFYFFGWGALLVITTTTVAAVLTEHLLCKSDKKESTIGDWSATITGILLGLTLPPNFPLWMAFLGNRKVFDPKENNADTSIWRAQHPPSTKMIPTTS